VRDLTKPDDSWACEGIASGTPWKVFNGNIIWLRSWLGIISELQLNSAQGGAKRVRSVLGGVTAPGTFDIIEPAMHLNYCIGVSADSVRSVGELVYDCAEGGRGNPVDVLGDEVVRLGGGRHESTITWDCELSKENMGLIWLRVERSVLSTILTLEEVARPNMRTHLSLR
jgi:hypothetical protein